MVRKLTYKGRPANITRLFHVYILGYCPVDGEPWHRVAIGSRTYLRGLCD